MTKACTRSRADSPDNLRNLQDHPHEPGRRAERLLHRLLAGRGRVTQTAQSRRIALTCGWCLVKDVIISFLFAVTQHSARERGAGCWWVGFQLTEREMLFTWSCLNRSKMKTLTARTFVLFATGSLEFSLPPDHVVRTWWHHPLTWRRVEKREVAPEDCPKMAVENVVYMIPLKWS